MASAAPSGNPGGLCPRHLDSLGRRFGSRNGHGGAQPQPSQPTVRRGCRADARLPGQTHRGRRALFLARRHLLEGTRGRPHRARARHHRRHRRRQRQRRWAQGSAGHGSRQSGGRAVLTRLPAHAQAASARGVREHPAIAPPRPP